MTTVLVAQRDPAAAASMADVLRAAGYAVVSCAGPELEHCPLLEGSPCATVDRADVLVYDAWIAGDADGGRRLVSELRDVYVDLPVILTSADASTDWVHTDGPDRVVPLAGQPDASTLLAAVETALADQGLAV